MVARSAGHIQPTGGNRRLPHTPMDDFSANPRVITRIYRRLALPRPPTVTPPLPWRSPKNLELPLFTPSRGRRVQVAEGPSSGSIDAPLVPPLPARCALPWQLGRHQELSTSLLRVVLRRSCGNIGPRGRNCSIEDETRWLSCAVNPADKITIWASAGFNWPKKKIIIIWLR